LWASSATLARESTEHGRNGEKMAELEKKTETENAKKKGNSKPKNVSRVTAKGEGAAANKKNAAGGPKRSSSKGAKDGAERLRRAVDRRVGKNSERLAEVLTNKALAGDLAFAKAVVALADAKKPDPVKKPTGPSFAEQLAMEPRWEGEPKDIENSDQDID